jgi:hypothetical protein
LSDREETSGTTPPPWEASFIWITIIAPREEVVKDLSRIHAYGTILIGCAYDPFI